MLAATRYPEINLAGYRAILDGYAADLREEVLNPSAPAADLLAVFNQFLFARSGYKGNEANDHDPEDCYLNRVVDRLMGNLFSLCVLYLRCPRLLRLPMTGIGFPPFHGAVPKRAGRTLRGRFQPGKTPHQDRLHQVFGSEPPRAGGRLFGCRSARAGFCSASARACIRSTPSATIRPRPGGCNATSSPSRSSLARLLNRANWPVPSTGRFPDRPPAPTRRSFPAR